MSQLGMPKSPTIMTGPFWLITNFAKLRKATGYSFLYFEEKSKLTTVMRFDCSSSPTKEAVKCGLSANFP